MEQRHYQKPGDKVFRPTKYRTRSWRMLLPSLPKPRTGPVSSLVLVYGFLGVIAIGTVLLILPISSQSRQFTSPIEAVFTATSAVCVTGLVVVDTADYWSRFGQAIILFLIQAGGFGFMTSATLFLISFGRRIGLRERLLIGEAMGLFKTGGLVAIVIRMAIFTVAAEIIGSILFYRYFSAEMTAGRAIWTSVFQAISSFNNAGFDLFGGFRSMAGYQATPLVVLLTAVLIFLGGISFLVVSDVLRKRNWSRMSLDSKIVMSTTLAMLVFGMIVVLLTESGDPDTLGSMSAPQRFLNAFFQSVTARTAGFSTINMANLHDYALFFTMLLMFVGGASGSTAGGIKVNTFGMVIATIWSTVRGREHAGVFGREFTTQQVYRALAVIMISLSLISIVVFLLTVTEELRFLNLLFETVSAFGTVGLSTGITPDLSMAGRLIITATMFAGRLGPLTLILALVQRQQPTIYRYPEEVIRIG